VTAGGKPESGVTVTIHAWPDQSVMQALKIGQAVPLVAVGSATTDSSGKYSVSVPVTKLLPYSTDGVVSLSADSTEATESFPVVVAKNAGHADLAASDPVVNLTASNKVCPLEGFVGKVGLH